MRGTRQWCFFRGSLGIWDLGVLELDVAGVLPCFQRKKKIRKSILACCQKRFRVMSTTEGGRFLACGAVGRARTASFPGRAVQTLHTSRTYRHWRSPSARCPSSTASQVTAASPVIWTLRTDTHPTQQELSSGSPWHTRPCATPPLQAPSTRTLMNPARLCATVIFLSFSEFFQFNRFRNQFKRTCSERPCSRFRHQNSP